MYQKKRQRVAYLFLIPAMVLFLLFVAYPVLNTLKTSLYSLRIQTLSQGGKFVGFQNFIKLAQDKTMLTSLVFTVGFTVVSVILETVLGMACALIMNRTFKGQGFVRAMILIPWCIPTIVSGLMWSYMFSESFGVINQALKAIGLSPVMWVTGVKGAFSSMIIADVWKTSPYMSLLLLSGLKTVPGDIYEAASIDGAGKIQQFFFITLPVIKPVVLVSVMFRTIQSFRIYDLVKVLTDGGPNNVTQSLTMYTMKQYFTFGDLGYGAALAVLTFAVSLMIAMFFYDGMKSKLEV
ncbi:sugar ABC transporter permease [Hungatella sp.]|jgi:multiple sugar transport system permease protein|uniref:carbohydrate ABC transporter permease n=1 Tax=Hungatella sp. TaxID=2613924 RepID=UPI002A7F2401|nr:sugar ABC transporter permease [Hungatella sp.]